jgi:hypothetical protein
MFHSFQELEEQCTKMSPDTGGTPISTKIFVGITSTDDIQSVRKHNQEEIAVSNLVLDRVHKSVVAQEFCFVF